MCSSDLGAEMFTDLNAAIREEVLLLLFHAQIEARPAGPEGGPLPSPQGPDGGPNGNLSYEHESIAGADAILAAGGAAPGAMTGMAAGAVAAPAAPTPVVKSEQESIGRNDPCWCGSGKKYKRCHGA